MNPDEVRRIREKLGLSPVEFADLLGLSGYGSIMNIENGVRRPNKLAIRLLRFLDDLPAKKATEFIERLRNYDVV